MKEKFISEFFAVTMTSVYHVTDRKDEDNIPIVEKIALKGESSIPIGSRLLGGHLVGITEIGIILYYEDYSPWTGAPERTQRAMQVNTRMWGGKTSPIVSLFLDKKEALSCLESESLEEFDSRWKKQTEEVLEVIGKDHPTFIV